MLIEELKYIIEKSKTKKDGIYLKSPYFYYVKNNKPVLFANKISGVIEQFCYGFLSTLGKVEVYNIKNELKRLSKDI